MAERESGMALATEPLVRRPERRVARGADGVVPLAFADTAFASRDITG